METTSTPSAVQLSDVASHIWARRRTVALCILTGLLLGAAASLALPPSYTATALVQVSPITSTPFSSTPVNQQINIETERNVMASPDVAALVVADLGQDTTPTELLEEFAVSTPQDSLVLRASYTSTSPQRAASIANAFSQGYLQLRSTRANEISEVLQAGIEDQILALSDGDFGETTSDAVQQQILELRQEQARLAAVGVDPGSVIGRAVPPTSPSSLSPVIFLAAGGALGLLIGLLLALLVEAMDPMARRAPRVAAATGSPVVVARGPDDEEAMLQLTGLLTQRMGQSGDSSPRASIVTVLAPDRPSRAITQGLADHLTRTDRLVRVRVLDEADEQEIDRGFPADIDRAGWSVDVVVLDVSALDSQARQAAVTGRSDHIILVARSKTRLSALRRWPIPAHTGPGQLVAVWFQRRISTDPGHGATEHQQSDRRPTEQPDTPDARERARR